MKYSLCSDFLNSQKVMFPFGTYLADYKAGKHDFAPWSVEIHPTARCNHRCIHCSYKERNESRCHMDKGVFDKLVDSLIKMKVKGVYFSGGGEPCIYEGLADAVVKLYDNGVESALVSNGSLIESSGVLDVADHFNYIALSVPSCTEDLFKKITGTENMSKVLSIPSKIKDKFGDKSPVIGSRVVVTNLIVDEVPHILETIKNRDFDYAIFKIVRDYEDRGLGVSDEKAAELEKVIAALTKEGKIDHDFTNLDTVFQYRKPYSRSKICHINQMGLLAAVTPEGDVYPNISEIGKKEFLVGNLYENSFEEIWYGKRHEEVKETSNRRWECGDCKNCRAISYNMIMEELLARLPVQMDPFI